MRPNPLMPTFTAIAENPPTELNLSRLWDKTGRKFGT